VRYEVELATGLWFASLALAYVWPETALYVIVGVTTINLLHARFMAWWAGHSLRDRVRAFLAGELEQQDERLTAMERDVVDIKESQIKIAGAFRGRNLPG